MDRNWYQQPDILMGIGVVAVIAMLVIPVPALILDTLMGVSIMLGLVTLLTAMYNRGSQDISIFPTLLLITTVFRLALNVSSTRMILTEGPAMNAKLIKAFGNFVVGGDYIIGFIVFLILIFVQMMVITKGATRISEVAARFTLDALPGKQMSIDSDLSAGIITEEEARVKRDELRKEVDFYGQMDGASKFVQGDVRVGLVITAINLIGGILIGTTGTQNLGLTAALKEYSLLTIGDGIVAQIPSLLITTATGMVVTRAGAEDTLGSDFTTQLFKNPRVLWLVGGFLVFAGFLPGFPGILWLIGGLMGFLAYSIGRATQEQEKTESNSEETRQKPAAERFLDEISVDPLKLEIGYNLVSLVSANQGGTLLEKITNLRQKFAREMGMIVPPIRINDNMELDGNEYSILVGGIDVAKAKAFPNKLAALDSGNVNEPIDGEPYQDPSYNLKAVLINPDQKSEAENRGYIIVDAGNIIITHLSEVLRNYATQIMGREEVKMLLDKIKEKYPSVVDDVLANGNAGMVQQVLHNLLKENVSVRNMLAILEAMADNLEKTKDSVLLTEVVRQRIGRQIVQSYLEDGTLNCIQIDPIIENVLRSAITYDEREGRIFTLDPHDQIRIRDAFIETYNDMQKQRVMPVFLAGTEVRTGIFMMLEREINPRSFAVLAYEELPSDIQPKITGQVLLREETEEVTA